MAKQKTQNKPSNGGPSDEERQQEASKSANAALAAQKKSKELIQAAAGAGDPEERQKLLNEALQKEMEAGSLGKTAKYLTSGSFQGLVAGTGIGSGIGAGLGTLTAALTGGLLSLVTGGVGAGVGAAHGPFLKLGHIAGGAVRKVTGDIPGWEASPEQQQAIEKMLGQMHDQEIPTDDDLTSMTDPSKVKVSPADTGDRDGTGDQRQTQSWTKDAASYMPSKDSLPSIPGWSSSNVGEQEQAKGSKDRNKDHGANTKDGVEQPRIAEKRNAESGLSKNAPSATAHQSKPVKSKTQGTTISEAKTSEIPSRRSTRSQTSEHHSSSGAAPTTSAAKCARGKPRKLDRQPTDSLPSATSTKETSKKKPRKLEMRSGE